MDVSCSIGRFQTLFGASAVSLCGWISVFLKPETALLRVMTGSHASTSNSLNRSFPDIRDVVIGSFYCRAGQLQPTGWPDNSLRTYLRASRL